ncbi:MAG: SRPBCC family protein [Flavobacteriaceae bacterium]
MSIESRTLTIERTFNAPIQLVWDAWTKAEHIVNWWGPKGMDTRVEIHQLKVGGQWKFIMRMPDGNDFIAEGEYKEIEAPNKLVTSADFRPMTEGVVLEVLLEADGDRTNFRFNVIHPTEEYCKQQEAMGFYNGWVSTFDRLAELLST